MRAFLPVLAVVLGGCYRYVAVDHGAPAPAAGAHVRVELRQPRQIVLQDVTVHAIRALQGTVLSSGVDSLSVAVTRLWGSDDERTYEVSGIGVTVGREEIAAVSTKRMSPGRSGLAIGLGGAGIVAMILSVTHLTGSGGGSGPPKPQP